MLVVLACMPCLACDELTLPVRPGDEGGVTGGGDGGTGNEGNMLHPPGAIMGEKQTQFGGDVETWAMLDGAGKVSELSFTLPMATVTGIPASTSVDVVWYIKLPDPVLQQTVFRSLDYSYLPAGHVPAGVYDTQHWEWHLSALTKEERDALDCSDKTMPPPEAIPDNWIVFPECIQKIGFHGFDLAAPEYNREKFTKGNYLSYYHGIFSGVEPQITRELLNSRADVPFNPSPRPKKFGKSGLYPTKFKSKFDTNSATYIFTYYDFVQVE
jgi:hypothetical protein